MFFKKEGDIVSRILFYFIVIVTYPGRIAKSGTLPAESSSILS